MRVRVLTIVGLKFGTCSSETTGKNPGWRGRRPRPPLDRSREGGQRSVAVPARARIRLPGLELQAPLMSSGHFGLQQDFPGGFPAFEQRVSAPRLTERHALEDWRLDFSGGKQRYQFFHGRATQCRLFVQAVH